MNSVAGPPQAQSSPISDYYPSNSLASRSSTTAASSYHPPYHQPFQPSATNLRSSANDLRYVPRPTRLMQEPVVVVRTNHYQQQQQQDTRTPAGPVRGAVPTAITQVLETLQVISEELFCLGSSSSSSQRPWSPVPSSQDDQQQTERRLRQGIA